MPPRPYLRGPAHRTKGGPAAVSCHKALSHSPPGPLRTESSGCSSLGREPRRTLQACLSSPGWSRSAPPCSPPPVLSPGDRGGPAPPPGPQAGPPPYLRQVEVEETERGELETGGEAVEQPVREEAQVSGRPEQGQGAAEREGGGEEGGPERCPQEAEEEAEALVAQPPLAVQQQPPQLQVGKGEERGVEQGVQDAERQLHRAGPRGAPASAGRRGLAAGRRTRHGHPHEGAGGRARERGKEGAGLGAAVEGEKEFPPHPPTPPASHPGKRRDRTGAPRRAAAAARTPPPLPVPRPPGGEGGRSRLLALRLGWVAAKTTLGWRQSAEKPEHLRRSLRTVGPRRLA